MFTKIQSFDKTREIVDSNEFQVTKPWI